MSQTDQSQQTGVSEERLKALIAEAIANAATGNRLSQEQKAANILAAGADLVELLQDLETGTNIPAFTIREFEGGYSDCSRPTPLLSEDRVPLVNKLLHSARKQDRRTPGSLVYEAQILATLEPLLAAQSRVFSILEQFTKYLLEIGILGPGFEPSLRAVFTTWDKLFEWIERLVKGRVACLEGFVSAGLPELQLQWNMRFGVYSGYSSVDAITSQITRDRFTQMSKQLAKEAAGAQLRKEIRADPKLGSSLGFKAAGRGAGKPFGKAANPSTSQGTPKPPADTKP